MPLRSSHREIKLLDLLRNGSGEDAAQLKDNYNQLYNRCSNSTLHHSPVCVDENPLDTAKPSVPKLVIHSETDFQSSITNSSSPQNDTSEFVWNPVLCHTPRLSIFSVLDGNDTPSPDWDSSSISSGQTIAIAEVSTKIVRKRFHLNLQNLKP